MLKKKDGRKKEGKRNKKRIRGGRKEGRKQIKAGESEGSSGLRDEGKR